LCACVSRPNFPHIPHLPLVPPLAARCSAVMPSRCRAASTVNFGCVSRTCTLGPPINWGCLGRLKWKVQLNKKKMWNVSEKYMDHVWPTICCDLKQIRMTGSRRKGIEKLKQQASEIQSTKRLQPTINKWRSYQQKWRSIQQKVPTSGSCPIVIQSGKRKSSMRISSSIRKL